MSYREENGQVVLTMSREDYELILIAIGAFTGLNLFQKGRLFAFMNRLNEGNPNYTPYQVEKPDASVR